MPGTCSLQPSGGQTMARTSSFSHFARGSLRNLEQLRSADAWRILRRIFHTRTNHDDMLSSLRQPVSSIASRACQLRSMPVGDPASDPFSPRLKTFNWPTCSRLTPLGIERFHSLDFGRHAKEGNFCSPASALSKVVWSKHAAATRGREVGSKH